MRRIVDVDKGCMFILFICRTSALFVILSLSSAMPYSSSQPLAGKSSDVYEGERMSKQYTDKYGDVTLLRPQPSDDLPIVPIKVPLSKGRPPSSIDLHARRLRKLLGGRIDTRYLHEKEPLDFILRPNGTLVYRFKKGRPEGDMPAEFKQLRFDIPDRRSSIRIKNKKSRRKVKQFLWSYSYCPVMYIWRDLGARVWPRWIREGSCFNDRASCSFPAGMTCKAEEKTDVYMLYWHCNAGTRKKKQATHCKWIRFQYSVITKCGCQC